MDAPFQPPPLADSPEAAYGASGITRPAGTGRNEWAKPVFSGRNATELWFAGGERHRCHTDVVIVPPFEVAPVVFLTHELTELRRRGFDDVDLSAGDDMHPLPPMLLEELARGYLGERAPRNRPDLLRQYFEETLDNYSSTHGEHESAFIRRLFFSEDEDIPARPKDLRDAAIIKTGLSDETFRKRSRAHFKRFAVFLLGLNADGAPVADEAVSSAEPVDTEQPESAPSRPGTPLRWLVAALAGALVIAVVVIAGLIMELRQRPSAQGSPEAPASTSPASPALTATDATLTFDDLGGGSPIIRVFHGVTDSPEDRAVTGTFSHGDTVRTICKKEGREVVSDTSVGEKPRKSSMWIRIEGTPGSIQFAPLTYARMSKEDLASLPICPG
jgi:hypothetical protein